MCSRGVCQGDPLLPLLFCHKLLLRYAASGMLVAMHSPGVVNCPTHVLYADDVLLFRRTTKANMYNLSSIFFSYRLLSGQTVNLSKLEIYFGVGITNHRASRLFVAVGLYKGLLLFQYLGVLLF